MNQKEAKERYPNLWKVAEELARCEHPYKVADIMIGLLIQENFEAPSSAESGAEVAGNG